MRVCDLEECGTKHYGQGYCLKHYAKWRKYGDPLGGRNHKRQALCTYEPCGRPYYLGGLCGKHYEKRRTYGLEPAEYEEMMASGCSVCGLQAGDYARTNHAPACTLHVDHDHATGKVRGILCINCNLALGHLGDDPEKIRKLLDYVQR